MCHTVPCLLSKLWVTACKVSDTSNQVFIEYAKRLNMLYVLKHVCSIADPWAVLTRYSPGQSSEVLRVACLALHVLRHFAHVIDGHSLPVVITVCTTDLHVDCGTAYSYSGCCCTTDLHVDCGTAYSHPVCCCTTDLHIDCGTAYSYSGCCCTTDLHVDCGTAYSHPVCCCTTDLHVDCDTAYSYPGCCCTTDLHVDGGTVA